MRILVLSTTLTRQRAGTAHATVDIANGLARLTRAKVTVAAYELDEDWLDAAVDVIKYEQAPSRKFLWRLEDVLAVDRCCRSLATADLSGFDLCYVRNTAEALAFHRIHPDVPLLTHTGAIIAGKELAAEGHMRSRFLLAANAAGRDHWEKQSYRQINWRHIVSTRLVARQRESEFKLPRDFFHVCPLPVDEATFNPSSVSHDVRQEFQIPPEQPVILTVSRLTRWKNIDAVLRAISQLPAEVSPYYLIVGQGRERETLEQLATELGIENRVRFLGHQPNTAPYYAAADVFVLPSSIESFGLVYAEAMHMGLPCIGLAHNPPKSISAASDVIPDGGGCCVKDANELRAAIEEYVTNPQLCKTHGAAAQAHAREEYSVANYISFLAKIVDDEFGLQIPLKSSSPADAPVAST